MIKIVIIDDEVQILNMLEIFFKRMDGYSVETFSSPISGLNYVLSNNVDVVLLDIMMPQMDGIQVLYKIKEKKPDVKVIMMTAYSTLDKVLQTHKQGADSYLMKPFESLATLQTKVKEVLNYS
jgi:DNA-binding NtrC family response regulator